LSYDLHVIAKRRPKAADLQSFLDGEASEIRSSGSLKRGGGVLLEDGLGIFAELDGPVRVEPEDVPPKAAGAIGRSGWLVEISVKPSSDSEWPRELAIHLARATDGVVYDPQLDEVIWPGGWRPRDLKSRVQVIDVVEITWFFAQQGDERKLPVRLLKLLRELCPAALPRRYGEFEPFQHRFEGDVADSAFADFWVAQAASPIGLFFWTTARPCLGATVSVAPSSAGSARDSQPCTRITLTFDGRPFQRDPNFTEAVVRAFIAVVTELDCVYAAACLNRGYILRGNSAFSGGGEAGPVPPKAGWVGLPASPTWLAWFGRPYAELVRTAVTGHVTLEADSGLFLRLGRDPMNADELAAVFPPLPKRLLARRHNQPGRWLPGVGAPSTSQRAEELPKLRD
jgi:hypothetical protein